MAAISEDKVADPGVDQLNRNLSHILIPKKIGPKITIGSTVLKFKKKAPVSALAILVGTQNQVDSMSGYIKGCLVAGQEGAFDSLMDDIDLAGLGEIMGALSEAYTSFPEES